MKEKQWYRLGDQALFERKISDLPLKIQGTTIEPLINKLYKELKDRGLLFRPPCFLADEWFCPVGVPAIGIPFFLSHPRLRRLEQKTILEVEGNTRSDFMKLIRHEAGHAYSYAYSLYKKPTWRKLFGSASKEYPETYRPRPYSRSYVIHLENWYAQSHPDEDFAETFAVWLTPGHRWKSKYRSWKAFEKLNYVDGLMRSIRGKAPKNQKRFNPAAYSGLNIKLKTYYLRKKKLYEESYPDFYDKDLNILFTADPEQRGDMKAFRYLRKVRPNILKSVAEWTKEKKYTIDQLMENLISRTKELGLYIRKDRTDLDVQTSSYVTSLVTNYLFTGKFKRSK